MTLYKKMFDYSNTDSFGVRLRQRRTQPLQEMITTVFREQGCVSILDVGGMEYYWNIFPEDFLKAHKVRIVILNLADDVREIKRPDLFHAEEGDGCKLPYANNQFDICHSNSVIEHVGSWQRKMAFAAEGRRVAPRYWHQTPNFWFPWEPHYGLPFYHWLPEPMRLAIACRFNLAFSPRAKTVAEGMATVDFASLLSRRMFASLFPGARVVTERFAGLAKSFTAYTVH